MSKKKNKYNILMKSKKIQIKKNINNKTIKRKTFTQSFNPLLKILHKGYFIYASKKFNGDEILKYTKEQEEKYKDSCLFGNMSWFSDYEIAKGYVTKETNINKWKIIKNTKLLKTNQQNQHFIETLFRNYNSNNLETSININSQDINKIKHLAEKNDIKYNYIYLSQIEKALYEFMFAYGYISLEYQYEFMKFMKFLIKHKFINIKRRDGTSIINKLTLKIYYYNTFNKLSSKNKHHRLSFYIIDKNAMTNLCKISPKHYEISGVFQANTKSFWYPNIIFNKIKNIKEYVLFNPHNNLNYEGIVK
jgi:hypothetical protein